MDIRRRLILQKLLVVGVVIVVVIVVQQDKGLVLLNVWLKGGQYGECFVIMYFVISPHASGWYMCFIP